jgi:hypothetical protein
MQSLNELGRRIEMLLHRRRFRADLEEEMQLHIDLRQQPARAGTSASGAGDLKYALTRGAYWSLLFSRTGSSTS